jgi:hypothetical protein
MTLLAGIGIGLLIAVVIVVAVVCHLFITIVNMK